MPAKKQKLRLYQPIWIKLKQTGRCKIAAPQELHARIVKAVIKEKHIDLEHKLEIADEAQRVKLQYKATGAQLEFWLVSTIKLSDIG